MSEVVVAAEQLSKTFAIGFFRKRVEAVRSISFSVHRNEVYGFLGPNGAGKTTTIKMLMGLIFPSGGTAKILGATVPDKRARERVGFLPETPYFYDYLNGPELLDLYGRLFGLSAHDRRTRAARLLERVGLGQVDPRLPLRKYSKGMLQRIGIAQALINEPELVVLDEPMSGLDPIGRKEVRDLILELRQEGRTVMFSTHILSDVELLCDRVAMVVGGKMHGEGPLDTLLSPRLLHTEVVTEKDGQKRSRKLDAQAELNRELQAMIEAGEQIVSVMPRKESLEDLFVREVSSGDTGSGAALRKKSTESQPIP